MKSREDIAKKTIKEIKEDLEKTQDLSDPLFDLLIQDSRKGVHQALRRRRQTLKKAAKDQEDYYKRLLHEKDLADQGYQKVAGLDEVGRGPLAGPVVAACVILPADTSRWIQVRDSKQISDQARQDLVTLIQEEALAYSYGLVSAQTIDCMNILEATKLAMQRALENLSIQPDYLLVDALELPVDYPQKSLIQGDDRSLSIAAASILAKDYRDQIMADYDQTFPGYGFAKNVGYGTKEHLTALESLGPCPIHRQSFAPLRDQSITLF